MHDVLKFVGDYWWLLIGPAAGVAEWVADQFDAGLAANSKRRRRKVKHQQQLREIELEKRRRELEARHPKPVEPICGCRHHFSFHNPKTGDCHDTIAGRQYVTENGETTSTPIDIPCSCQRYVGPEPLSQVYADPLADM